MKKALLGLIILILISNCAGCGSNNSPATDETQGNQETQESSTAATEFEEIHWTEEYYVDEFNDPTDKKYIRGAFEGTFSNSATSSSYLAVYFFVDKELTLGTGFLNDDVFRIRLVEYGNHKASFLGVNAEDVQIKIKVDDVVTEGTAYYIDSQNGEIYISRNSLSNNVFADFMDAMENEEEVSFVITVSSYGRVSSTYRFDVDANGLSEIDHKWIGSMGTPIYG